MELLCLVMLVVFANVNGENCDLGGNPCQCSDDMSLVMCTRLCLKDIADLDIPEKYWEKVKVLDLQQNCLTKINLKHVERLKNLEIINVKNQRFALCHRLNEVKIQKLKVVSDCKLTTLQRIVTASLTTTKDMDKYTEQDHWTESADPIEETTVSTTRRKFKTRKPYPKFKILTSVILNITTGLPQNLTVFDSTLPTDLPQPSDLPQPTENQLNIVIAVSTTCALLSVTVIACGIHVCCDCRCERNCSKKCSKRCNKRNRRTYLTPRMHFPRNQDVETLSGDSIELFSVHEKCQ